MNNIVLETHNLTIGYRRPDKIIADGLSLSLGQGELVCLLGPNGAGKSTLLRTLTGMQPPLGGHVTLLGERVDKMPAQQLAKRLSVVLTERVDLGTMSAYGVVALGRHPYTDWMGRLSEQDKEVVQGVMEAVGAAGLANENIAELSDGQRQKIMIARALAQEPKVMVLDEPTAFLDLPHRVEVMRILRDLAHREGKSVLLSVHDLDLALRSADRIWLMSEDVPIEVGAPEDLILNGAFERAFQREGITFDAEVGAFEVKRPQGKRAVAVSGEGLYAVWTRRALERVGFVVDDGASVQIKVLKGEPGVIWQSAGAEYHSIYEMLSALNR